MDYLLPFEDLSSKVRNLLARHYITVELLPALSINDLKAIRGLGEKGLWEEVVPSILAAGITLRHVLEPREEFLREIYPDPRKIPASNMVFEGVLSDTLVTCINTPKAFAVPVYGDIAKLSKRKALQQYRKTRCEWIMAELAKYDLTFRR
jgi:hypothetical protein